MKRVLILCTGNSCRSQMAEALWNRLGRGHWDAVSAGSDPAGYVHPLAIASLAEIGINITGARSKHVREFDGQRFDLVVTVCDNAREACPAFPHAQQVLHWPFDDPAALTGGPSEIAAGFARIREQIAARIAEYLQTP